MTPKQRARRWRAACPLTDNDGVPDGWEIAWNIDSDGDGSWCTSKLINDSNPIVINYKNSTNALDPDSDNDGLLDGVEMGMTSHVIRNGVNHSMQNIGIIWNSSDGRYEDSNIDWYDNGTYYWCPRYVSNPFNTSNYESDSDPNTITDMTSNDTDNDGLTDGQEDIDGDGTWDSNEPNPWDMDSDDDGVSDGDDGLGDADNDSIPNCVEHDSDNDGIYDGTELGIILPIPDNINENNSSMFSINGTNLSKEYFVIDEDPSTTTDPFDNDTDDDGLLDGIEDMDYNGVITFGETDPNDKDTDNDGLADGWIDQKVWNSTLQQFISCSEGTAGIFDQWEGEDWNKNGSVDKDENDNFLETSPTMTDTDGDFLGDGDEAKPEKIQEDNVQNPENYSSNPLRSDTDNDSLSDYLEITGWNITIIWESTLEIAKGPYLTYSNPNDNDTDNDSLLDGDEFVHSSDPAIQDSDGDNVNDKTEVDIGTNPVTIDGTPPIIEDLQCFIKPIIKIGSNGIEYLTGIEIEIILSAVDPAGVYYIEIEINEKIIRKYVQMERKQVIIKNISINITMQYPYSEKEMLFFRVADFYGNVNKSIMKPINKWPMFYINTYNSIKPTAKAYVYIFVCKQTYGYDVPTNVLPSKVKSDIRGVFYRAIKALYSNIKSGYNEISDNFDKYYNSNTGLNNKNYIDALNNYKKWQYAGFFLCTFMKIFKTGDYDYIKQNIYDLSQSVDRCHNLGLGNKYDNFEFDLHDLCWRLYKDIITLSL